MSKAKEKNFDVVIIGAGPGGYVCAVRCAQLGLSTALIDKRAELGGTCLNVGCIPSKALLHSTEILHEVQHNGEAHGIAATGVKPNIPALMKRKDKVVAKLRAGVQQLTSRRGVTLYQGAASIQSPGVVHVNHGSSEENTDVLNATHTIIATGSEPVELPFLPFDGKSIISSTEALTLKKAPKRMVVVGGGAIGLEMGSVWARLGSEVTIVEYLPNISPGFDKEMSKALQRSLEKQGLKFSLETKVTGLEKKGTTKILQAEKGGKATTFEADAILVAVGRKAYTKSLGLENADVQLDDRGRVIVNEHFKSSVKGIYAIGDVIAGPMLAHKAEDEGVALAEQLAGKAGHVNYGTIPGVVYTYPEAAQVGLTEAAAKEQGIAVKTGKFAFAGNGRALACMQEDGMAKVIACKQTDKLLGVQIVGAHASEMIAAAVTHMEYGGSAEDLARTVTAHPTLSEAVKEAAMAVDKRAIHAM